MTRIREWPLPAFRHGGAQLLGVGMLRVVEDLGGRAVLDDLDDARAQAAVRTLVDLPRRARVAGRSAERLHLHRNAVAYRMRQIRERLAGVDLDDPDRRLELQLACRAWLLGR